MPSVAENRESWNETYTWERDGDEWSDPWGGAEAQWHFTLLPRIHAFVPTGILLEIAPGFGRWTRYLRGLCESLVVVDLSERCISACRKRFAAAKHVKYYVNDGFTLPMLPNRSIDFAFSFDSLVHAEADVVDSYLAEVARVLQPEGVAFLHHSNLGQCAPTDSSEDLHWRAPSV